MLRGGPVYVRPDDLCGRWLYGKLIRGTAVADPIARDMIAYFSVNYANKAIAWYRDVFRAIEAVTPICLADAVDDGFGGSPNDLGGTPVRMPLNTKDATVAAAAKARVDVLIPVADQVYGQRVGRIRDPFGHVWLISQPIEDASSEETQRRMDAMMQGGGG